MDKNEFFDLQNFISNLPDPQTAEEIALTSYSDMIDDFSIALINYRMKHNLNQNQLADILGCSQTLVSAYENGARNISAEKLCTLMAKLGKSVSLSFEDTHVESEPLSVNRIFPSPSDPVQGETRLIA